LVKPEKPVPPQIQPTAPEPEPVEIEVDVKPGVVIGVLKPPVDIVLPVTGGDQAMPFIKVQPQYPATASARGIEGYVDVVFDVAATGATENIRIVNAFPSSVFNRSVVQAIKRWKYKPKLVDNQPVKSFDVRERITFELEKG
jgi:protein TonB